MNKRYILFADLDDTLIETVSGNTFPSGIWDMKFRFDVLDKLRYLGIKYLFIVSNQGWISNGNVDGNHFAIKMTYICKALKEYLNCEVQAAWCPNIDDNDIHRKPNIGMLVDLCRKYLPTQNLDLIREHAFMIGDASGKEGQFSDSDLKTAQNFGIPYYDVEDFVYSGKF